MGFIAVVLAPHNRGGGWHEILQLGWLVNILVAWFIILPVYGYTRHGIVA